MDFQRPILIAAIAAVSLMLLVEWNKFQQAHKPALANAEQVLPETPVAPNAVDAPLAQTQAQAQSGDAPTAPAAIAAATPVAPASVVGQIVDVYSDKLHLKIDLLGGDIVFAALRDYPAKINEAGHPFVLLTRTNTNTYIAQSGLIGDNGIDQGSARPQFIAQQARYEMAADADRLVVDLALADTTGAQITKRYEIQRGEHLVKVSYLVKNTTAQPWSAYFYGQIKRDTHEPVSTGGAIGISPYLGGATTTAEHNYQKLTFKDMAKTPLQEQRNGGWIAMVQHYFVSAWIPDSKASNRFYTKHDANADVYFLGFTGPRVEVGPQGEATLGAQFYVGPKDVKRLEQLAPYLDLTVDYGVLWWIAKPLFALTHWIHSLVGNWGLAIIGLTLCVKALFLWPSTLSYRSMAVMKKLAPKMQEMKEAYGDNPTKLREEMFKMYQKEKANPMLGCLPMIIQTPVFIALYWSLMESVELRQAPFYGWIVDLSVQDPYFVLPLLMGVSMWVQQKLNPPAADPMQQKVFQFMPIIFTGMFLFFPAGLVLYMLVNNLISMTHQFWVYKSMEKPRSA
ncbi:MAG: membrane protein insertase YidC [Pseudomonadales bacterium]|nr:membrane protein insertase YidC [Pseudomonadales bacterium]